MVSRNLVLGEIQERNRSGGQADRRAEQRPRRRPRPRPFQSPGFDSAQAADRRGADRGHSTRTRWPSPTSGTRARSTFRRRPETDARSSSASGIRASIRRFTRTGSSTTRPRSRGAGSIPTASPSISTPTGSTANSIRWATMPSGHYPGIEVPDQGHPRHGSLGRQPGSRRQLKKKLGLASRTR